jgi:hypothetical protein
LRNLILAMLMMIGLVSSSVVTAEKKAPAPKPANPTLTANIDGVNSAATKSNALQIGSMDVGIVVRGSVAETTVTTRFDNPTNQTLEGDFTLEMPIGSVVTGYALDVAGTMVDGVLVPPRQAQLAYVQRVARRVDPGIAEVTRGSVFNTRVFPIFPRNGRTIRLRFVTPLDPANGYQMPLVTSGPVGKFALSIRMSGVAGAPNITLSKSIRLSEADGTLKFSAEKFAVDGNIGIAPAKLNAPILFSEHRGEGRFFEIADSAPAGAAAETKGADHVAIMWDRSRSRADNKIAEEIALVERYLSQVKPRRVDLILFDSGTVERRTLSTSTFSAALRSVTYGGATSFEKLSKVPLEGADTCLLFSDGISTLEKASAFQPACTLFAITSTREADRGFLDARARRTGGETIDLAQRSIDDVLMRLTRRVPRVIDVRSESGDAIDYALLDGGVSGWRIIGEAPNAGALIVKLTGIGPGITERRYSGSTSMAAAFDGPGALWAANRIAGASADLDRKQILALARRYSVASPAATFIVLETPEDYAQAEIEPPASYAKDQRARYDMLQKSLLAQKEQAQSQKLALVLGQWDEARTWWARKFDPNAAVPKPKLPPAPRPTARARREEAEDASASAAEGAMSSSVPTPMSEPPPGMPAPPPPPPPPPPVMAAPPPSGGSADGDIVVTSQRRQPSVQDSPVAVTAVSGDGLEQRRSGDRAANASATPPSPEEKPAISVQPWASDRPYIAAYDAAGGAFAKAFAEQEKKHGTLPAFYLDTAEYLAAKGDKAAAARMAVSALELPARNNNTLDIVAARLLRYGEVDRAIWLLEQLVELEPERPQPRRSLALALIARAKANPAAAKADLRRALDLLAEIVMKPWPGEYTGVELTALFDANAIIPKLRALGETKFGLDTRLIALLDTDIRVVIDWNTRATDMDLWVDEPSGERVIYSANRSRRGGFLSRDMTGGYGPEQYFIRRASTGRYLVRVNTFATDRLNPNGATTVTARLIRNYGRANEVEELVDLEVLPGSSGERLIGKIEVKP